MPITVTISEQLVEAERSAWERFWAESRHAHPRQHPALADVERATGRAVWFARAERDGELVGAAVIGVHPLWGLRCCAAEAVCRRGPAFDDAEAGRALLEAIAGEMRRLRAGRLRISPYWYGPEASGITSELASLGFRPLAGSPLEDSAWIGLAKDEDAVLGSFSRTVRKQIRDAHRAGVTFSHPATAQDADVPAAAIARLQRERGLAPLLRSEFDAMLERILVPGDLGMLAVASRGDRFLGAIAFIRSRETAHSLYFTVDPEAAREIGLTTVAPALWWEGIRWARERGCLRLDMEGRAAPLGDGDDGHGFEGFKGRFHPEPAVRIAEHVLVCNVPIWSLSRVARTFDRARRRVLAAWIR